MKKIVEKIKSKLFKTKNEKKEENFSISLKDFTDYCKNHALLITLTILVLALAHGTNIFYNNMGIDTQMFIEIPDFEYNWLGIGRFGLLVEKFLLGLNYFSPYYAGVLFFIFLVASNAVLYYTFYKLTNKDFGLINLCIPLIAFTNPVFVEQFIYQLQYAEISSAIFLTSIATLFIFTWLKNKNLLYCLAGIICLIISFASYQSFIFMYITFCIFAYVLMFENDEKTNTPFKDIVKLLVTFGIAFLGYQIMIKILPSDTRYLDSSFFWGSYPLRSIYEFVIGNFKEVLLGRGNYYNLGYTIGAIAFVLVILFKIFRKKDIEKTSSKIWYILSCLAFIGTPFYMVLALGHAPMLRAQLILPFTEAFLIMMVAYYCFKNRWIKYLAMILVVYVFQTQMYMTQTLYYTDKMRNESDIQTAYEIIHDLGENGVKEKNVLAIVGHRDAKLNPVCITGETVGISLFTTNYAAAPYYFHSSSIILRLFKCLGYSYNLATPEQIQEARVEAQNMPVWPETGSIKVHNGYVIVKISEDELPL